MISISIGVLASILPHWSQVSCIFTLHGSSHRRTRAPHLMLLKTRYAHDSALAFEDRGIQPIAGIAAGAKESARVRGEEMGLTGDTRPQSRRSAGGSSTDEINRVKTLGSWISGAAAHVSAQVSQSIANAKTPSVAGTMENRDEGERRDSIAPPVVSLQRTASVKSAISTLGAPELLTPSSIRPTPNNYAPSFLTARATLSSFFTSTKHTPAAAKPEDDELCTLDLTLALPAPTEDTSVKDLKEIHATAVSSLVKFQKAYRSRVQQIKTLKQEAELRAEELEVEKLRSRTLEARLEGMQPRIHKEVALHERPDTAMQLVGTGQKNRPRSRTMEDGESNRNSVFSSTEIDTPITNTTITSSAASIYSNSGTSATSTPVDTDAHSCTNCKGKTSSYAWLVLSKVRTDNQSLRDKCRELEEGINDALDKLKGRR